MEKILNNTPPHKQLSESQNRTNQRYSNFELLRIVCIFFILGFHYLYHSGLINEFDYSHITPNMLFLQFFCFGGKMAINAFVLLSAYFICLSKPLITWKRILKLYAEVLFYSFGVFAILTLTGVADFSLKELCRALIKPFNQIGWAFAGSFIFFYMLIPVLNRLLLAINRNTHKCLIFYLLFVYTCLTTIPIVNGSGPGGYLGWFITLYLVASYIRIYNPDWTNSKKLAFLVFSASLCIQWAFTIFVDFVGSKHGFVNPFFMVVDSYKLLAFTMALSLFLFFKNIEMKNNKFINTIAASTFGVYLIHSPSHLMRKFLWNDLFHTTDYYNSNLLPIHMFGSIIIVYIVCVGIDYCRIKFIEKPFFNKLSVVKWLNNECLIGR